MGVSGFQGNAASGSTVQPTKLCELWWIYPLEAFSWSYRVKTLQIGGLREPFFSERGLFWMDGFSKDLALASDTCRHSFKKIYCKGGFKFLPKFWFDSPLNVFSAFLKDWCSKRMWLFFKGGERFAMATFHGGPVTFSLVEFENNIWPECQIIM